ncbi:sugar phosphate nucleotidyltransferase [Gammaproteobacteria bacterium]|nr:sugar phosphate nucleotidyltransferase [Gammaproteobacteria bacterium]
MKGIILAGGPADKGLQNIFGEIPAALVPLNGKPSIQYVMECMIKHGIDHFVITLDFDAKRVQKTVEALKLPLTKIEFIKIPSEFRPGYALSKAINCIDEEAALICLSDSIIEITDPCFDEAFIAVSKIKYQSKKWCGVKIDADNNVSSFEDKNGVETEYVACGMYYLPKTSEYSVNEIKDIEISEVLIQQLNGTNLIKKLAVRWWDLGHLDGYFNAKSEALSSRHFNTLKVDNFLGTIKKTSEYFEKFRHEILWQVNLPKDLKPLVPRVLDFCADDSKDLFIVSEYYGYPTLSDLWLFPASNNTQFKKMLDKCIEVSSHIMTFSEIVKKSDYFEVYHKKTLDRITSAKSNSTVLENLFSLESLTINGRSLKGWPILKSDILSRLDDLYNQEHNCHIHGDFCFSNILYDQHTDILRMIDPRGKWGNSIGGDIKYDLAKLRHSISGLYDFIVTDMFYVELNKDSIILKKFSQEIHVEIAKYFDESISKKFDLDQIKLIEGLLFLSMISLHSDVPDRQIAMFSTGIELLNEI